MTAQEALQKYFGYEQFRPLQEQIVQHVLDGKDTLALMPTGGGKSLCFQIPTLVEKGLCLVITPLIALMKDQVENLRRRGIQAAAIYTGMSHEQQLAALDNCHYGPYRFLYVSPERLESDRFRQHLKRLPITLIAVDEAHCISQWGYDFRPSYLNINKIRKCLKDVHPNKNIPVLALTATATPDVVEDIQERLAFREKCVLKKSFARTNLSYVVRYCLSDEHQNDASAGGTGMRTKSEEMLHILSHVAGSSIVYVRNRKRAQELAKMIGCSFYHAGLTASERNQRQEEWKSGKERIIVCTNAFGMGIDKADVRLVIHYDLPDNIESYFQEAGRAGRDEKNAYAVLLYAPDDRSKAQHRIADNYPTAELIDNVYHKMSDFFCVGAGSGFGHSFALHIEELCRVMKLPILQTYSALHLLSQAGYIDFQEEQESQPRVKINVPREALKTYQLSELQKQLINRMMRVYTGVFTDLQYLHEEISQETHEALANMASRHIITYIPRTRACLVTYTRERQAEIYLSKSTYEARKERFTQRLRAMVEYAEQRQFCRSQVLLAYFGENNAPCCNTCDVCRGRK